MNKIVLPMFLSCAANAAPRVLPTVQPIEPQRIWLTKIEPDGRGISRTPKLEVPGTTYLSVHALSCSEGNRYPPVSATMISFDLKNWLTRGHSQF